MQIIINSLAILLVIFTFLSGLAKSHSLSVMYTGIFSMLCALLYLLLKAPDVALTEAAIGGCISTVIMIYSLKKLGLKNYAIARKKLLFFGVVICLLIAWIIYIELQKLPIDQLVNNSAAVQFYINNTKNETQINSIVAAILANFRALDTLGETLVIYSAFIAVKLISEQHKNEN